MFFFSLIRGNGTDFWPGNSEFCSRSFSRLVMSSFFFSIENHFFFNQNDSTNNRRRGAELMKNHQSIRLDHSWEYSWETLWASRVHSSNKKPNRNSVRCAVAIEEKAKTRKPEPLWLNQSKHQRTFHSKKTNGTSFVPVYRVSSRPKIVEDAAHILMIFWWESSRSMTRSDGDAFLRMNDSAACVGLLTTPGMSLPARMVRPISPFGTTRHATPLRSRRPFVFCFHRNARYGRFHATADLSLKSEFEQKKLVQWPFAKTPTSLPGDAVA